MVRGTVVLPARHGQGRARRRLRPGREGPGGAARRRRRGRRRGPGQEDRGRLARVRRRARDAGHDGHGRQARPDPRPPRPDAEPQVRHVTFDIERAIGEVKAGRVEFKVDKGAIIHVPFGKASFERGALVDNLAAPPRRGQPGQARPAPRARTSRTLTIASTMGPGIRVDLPARPRGRRRLAGQPQRRRAGRDRLPSRSAAAERRAAPDRRRTAADSLRPRAAAPDPHGPAATAGA